MENRVYNLTLWVLSGVLIACLWAIVNAIQTLMNFNLTQFVLDMSSIL